MLRRYPLIILALVTLAAGFVIWSCDRMEGDLSPNQLPVVEFINVPLDSSQFNYAPTVYWFGYDPDGLITGYQFHDDQTQAAVDSYQVDGQAGHEHALLNYINSLPATAWTSTENTQETIYLLTQEGDTTEHVFVVRSVDNLGATSIPKVRIFFRTNQAPNTPEVKKVAMDDWEREGDYAVNFVSTDTLYIGDKPTLTWTGIQFVWKGSDPDDRELNIIPLQYSYLLTNLTTGNVVPFPRVSEADSTQVDWIYDWSDWGSATQVVFSAERPNMETGDYLFELRVRDDGLTPSDTNATATFFAIRPAFDKQLLIVDENRTPAGIDFQRGGRSDTSILAFYDAILPESFNFAEYLRPFLLPDLTEPFVYDTTEGGPVAWFRNKNLTENRYIPFDFIHHFKWVWIIDDDNKSFDFSLEDTSVTARQKSMARYMDVGGQLMISGRKIFAGSYNVTVLNGNGPAYGPWFSRYFNLQSIQAKTGFSTSDADFGGATTTNPILANLQVDSSVTCSLRYGNSSLCCLPEIDYFGRTTSSSGYDYSETLYNYSSCTANQSYNATDIDCRVISSTPTQAILAPAPGHTRILHVTRAYNLTRDVYGEVMGTRYDASEGWEIIVSTPAEAGAWQTTDTLQVDYSYIPISLNNDQPIASRFIRIEGVLDVDQQSGRFRFVGETRFRTSLFTFPLSFMDTTHVDIQGFGNDLNPVSVILAEQLLFFNSPEVVQVGNGGD